MWASLCKLAALPPPDAGLLGPRIHRRGNARFALTIEPGNPALRSRAEAVAAARAEGRPTVPSSLTEELATNPFLRAADPGIAAHLDMMGADPAAVFARIRSLKDGFLRWQSAGAQKRCRPAGAKG